MAIQTEAKVIEVAICSGCNNVIVKCPECLEPFFEDDKIYCIYHNKKQMEHFHEECVKDGKKK